MKTKNVKVSGILIFVTVFSLWLTFQHNLWSKKMKSDYKMESDYTMESNHNTEVLPIKAKLTAASKNSPLSLTNKTRHDMHTSRGMILFSYMRSGSTVVGEMFRDSPSVFYVFEPLIDQLPFHYINQRKVCNMSIDLCLYNNTQIRIAKAMDIVYNIYTCNIHKLPVSTVARILQEKEKSGPPWIQFGLCLKHQSANVCFSAIEQTCRNSALRVIKILRLEMSMLPDLLMTFPKLKVLFLVRDPRGILNSRIQTDWFPVYENSTVSVQNNINSLCKKMNADINDFNTITKIHSIKERITVLSIEKLASGPSVMYRVLDYVVKEVTNEDKAWMDAFYKAHVESQWTFKWKSQLKQEHQKYTKMKCYKFFEFLTKF